MKNIKTIYWDMDGTMADLYGVKNWLKMLREEKTDPYHNAEPLLNMERITELCQQLQNHGVKIGIISWLAKGATPNYKFFTRWAKIEWLKKHMPIKFDELHFVQYGTPKHAAARDRNGIIIDDDARVRKNWDKYGMSVNPQT